MSSPTRGTWIEISGEFWWHCTGCRSSPTRGTWIEIHRTRQALAVVGSSPTRGTWIEIKVPTANRVDRHVVPHAGDVDRNQSAPAAVKVAVVVPHAGDVDRNALTANGHTVLENVVPHAGDVDRNT